MSQVLSLTGASGVGKTSIAKTLISRSPTIRMVTSFTTKKPRSADIPGEYEYISNEVFDEMKASSVFLWTVDHAGVHYATEADPIKAVCEAHGGLGIMILVPAIIPVLRDYLASIGRVSEHVPIYIVPPRREILVRRMNERGDTMQDMERRLVAEASWETQACASAIPYRFIDNNGNIEDAVQAVFQLLS